MTDMFDEYHELPDGLLEVSVENLHQILPRPALIHLQGQSVRPLFISTLLHGNETTGFYALQQLLREYFAEGSGGHELPRSMSIFIGNVKAAQTGVRRLEQQVDYNRVWPGTPHDYLAEAHMMQRVTDIMRERHVEASIDIHNNTGKNPHYACINKLDREFIALACLFSQTLVYFTTPKGVQSGAFAELCPSVTLECGMSGQAEGTAHVLSYLQQLLSMPPLRSQTPGDFDLFHTVARVTIPEFYSFGFEDDATINLLPELENYNFIELAAGTVLARIEPESSAWLQAFDENEHERGRDFFEYRDEQILLKRPVMPAMITMNTQIIRQDCLCYLMERYPLELDKN